MLTWRGNRPAAPHAPQPALFMPNDSKLALVLGIVVVLLIGVVFFRKDEPAAPKPAAAANIEAPAQVR